MRKVELRPNPESEARLTGYLHDVTEEIPRRAVRPCVLICPGGGYSFLSSRESDPPAFAFFSRGYNVFILYYSVQGEASGLRPLTDISCAVMEIRKNSDAFGILPDRIAVCGFSSGGHVAASLGTLWNHPALLDKLDTQGGLNRPNALILCYPVISGGEFAHRGSFEWLTGGTLEQDAVDFYSLEKQVGAHTPPTFLWHTVDDKTVPVENTLLFAAALQRSHVPFECHVYQTGAHGLSLCNAEVNTPNPHCSTWLGLCAEWLGTLFEFDY